MNKNKSKCRHHHKIKMLKKKKEYNDVVDAFFFRLELTTGWAAELPSRWFSGWIEGKWPLQLIGEPTTMV